MKAERIHNYGGPEVLRFEDAPHPTPGSGELLIRLYAASVNPPLVPDKSSRWHPLMRYDSG